MSKKESTVKMLAAPPTKWQKLSLEQLLYVHSHTAGQFNSEIEQKLNVFLYLAGLEWSARGAEMLEEESKEKIDGSAEERLERIGEILNDIQGYMRGDLFFLSPVGDEETVYQMTNEQLVMYARHFTQFIDEDPFMLPSLPCDKVVLGETEYKVPDSLMMNITYQQYSFAQSWMTQYWSLMQRLMPPNPEAEKKKSVADGKVRSNKRVTKPKKPKKLTDEEVREIVKQISVAQTHFVAALITPIRGVTDQKTGIVRQMPVYCADDEDDTIRLLTSESIKVCSGKDTTIETNVLTLFRMLYQQVQSSLRVYHKKFPDMFSESKGDGNGDTFVAELGTVNSVMKYAGFTKAQDVYDENAVFIFKWLDTMSHEAKEMNKAISTKK